MFLKRISSKIFAVFLLLLIGLGSTIISGFIATDTQEQHIILSNLLHNMRYHVSKVVSKTLGYSDLKFANPTIYRIRTKESEKEIQHSITEIDKILNVLLVKRYFYENDMVTLKFSEDIVHDFNFNLKKAIEEWDNLKKLALYLIDSKAESMPEQYTSRLKSFRKLNKSLFTSSSEVVRLCENDAHKRKNTSNTIQLVSIILALSVFLFLIYHITVNFYTPLKEIKRVFRSMSRGRIKQSFKRTKDDEFTELYSNFNNFIDNLNTIFALEDTIILEEKLEQILQYIHQNFKTFIPFSTMGLKYRYMQKSILTTILDEEGRISTVDNGDDLEEFDTTVIEQNSLITPITINNTYVGYIFFSFKDREVDKTWINFLELFKAKLSMAFYKGILFKSLLSIITESLAEMAEAKDPETGLHLVRMSSYSAIIAQRLMEKGEYKDIIDSQYVTDLRISAPMHDIGKVATPDNILLKPGRLNEDEFKIMKEHATAGGVILTNLNRRFRSYGITYFSMAAEIANYHHEKYDGSGYPGGVSGEEIPLSAKIVAVADVFDALTSRRPYKEPFSIEKSLKIIEESSGTHFAPDIVKAFFEALPEIREIYEKYKEV